MNDSTDIEALAPRIRHRGLLLNAAGEVSALCFKKPRPINLLKASWVLGDTRVTCPKCLAITSGSG